MSESFWYPEQRPDTTTPALPRDTTSLHPSTTAEFLAAIGRSAEEFQNSHLASMIRADLPLLVGTDANLNIFPMAETGFSVPVMLASFVLAGMTPLQALQAATLDAARALEATDSLGTVEAGKVADLVLLDRDPTADIWHTTAIRGVVANGRYYDRAALNQLLEGAEQAAHTSIDYRRRHGILGPPFRGNILLPSP